MKTTKILGVTAAVITAVASGLVLYEKIKAAKTEKDETIDTEVKEEVMKKTEKVIDIATKTVTVVGAVCAWSWVLLMLNKKRSANYSSKSIYSFTQLGNDNFINYMRNHGVDMHGLTGNTTTSDVLNTYRKCYDAFVKKFGTGDDFINDLSSVLNIHSVFVRNDLADAMTGGRLHE